MGEYCGTGIAVGHQFGEAAVYAGGESHGVSVVFVFDEAGALKATWNGASTPGGSFGSYMVLNGGGRKLGTVRAVAVDNSESPLDAGAGNVYVAVSRAPGNTTGESAPVVDVFHPEAGGQERYVGQISGISPSEPFQFIDQVSVEPNGDVLVLNFTYPPGRPREGAIDVFEPTISPGGFTFIGKIPGPPPTGAFGDLETLATDAGNGDIYVTDHHDGYRIEQFSSSGKYLGHTQPIPDSYAIAVDSTTHYVYARETVYGEGVVIPDVTTAPVSSLKPESVTLNGTVDPDGAGAATCEFEWGTSESFGHVVPCAEGVPNGETPVPVHASLSGLERDQTYYYRLTASNENGTNSGEPWQDQKFATFGALLREEYVSDVSATSATFGAKVNPGGEPTSYFFEYGTSTEYGQQVPAAPGESVGSGTADVLVPARHVQDLSAGTVYHYRVVAVSETLPGQAETIYGPDRTFTTQAAGGAFSLADGRQWELVSPPDKLGAPIESLNDQEGKVVQAAAGGNAIAFRAGAPTEAEPQGFSYSETVFAARSAAGWSSRNISPPHERATPLYGTTGNEYQTFSEDLSHAAVQPSDFAFTPLSPQASEQTAYLRTDFGSEGAICTQSCFQPLVTGLPGYANVPAGTVFGEEPGGVCRTGHCGPRFEGASPDLNHIVLSSRAQLTSVPAPVGGKGALYEWSAGSLQLVGAAPAGEERPMVLAGTDRSKGHAQPGVRHAVSDDGQRVIMEGGTEGGDGLYMRELGGEFGVGKTIRLDVPQGGSGPSEGVDYLTASGDASRVLFLDSGHLTTRSSASGEDLYEYDLDAPAGSRLTDLTVDPNAGEAAAVLQVFGSSEDGSYVYFVARGALVAGAVPGGYNLYVSHEGRLGLVAALSSEDYALYQWHGGTLSERLLGRVSPNGQWVAFMSTVDLTGYDTHDAVTDRPDAEVYLYDAATGHLTCASCNPTGSRPTGHANGEGVSVAARVPGWTGPSPFDASAMHQPRYLSDSGRLFFDSTDALVAQDVDGTEDVYEYEPEGVGSCVSSGTTFVPSSGGCVNLVSAGTSPAFSEFFDVSETGGDVFFMTQSRLALQDYDTAYDVYDAHECTSAVPCLPESVQPPPCQNESSCRAAPTPQPALYGEPSSATFSGVGNVTPEASTGVTPKSKPASNARKLRAALAACRKKRNRKKRAMCERSAHAKYAQAGKAKKSTRRSK